MTPGEWLTRWSIRISLACAVLSLTIARTTPGEPRRKRWANRLWITGFVFYGVHVAAAFHDFHGWSHAHALRVTAQRTREFLGWNWGGGLYFNYALLVTWFLDVIVRIAKPDANDAGWRWARISSEAFAAFMAFQGAIVFASNPTRWSSLAFLAACAFWVAWVRWRGRAQGCSL